MNETASNTKIQTKLSLRLLWFVGLYSLGALTVALVAYGVRYWVGA